MKKIIILLFVCLFMTGCFGVNGKVVEEHKQKVIEAEKISYEKLNEIINDPEVYMNVDVIDIRSEEEYEEGHITGSINIPYESLDEIIISTDREVVVYDSTAAMSKQAANELISYGYNDVKYIAGLDNWPYELE